jgi:hypothetical protein
MEPHHRSRWPYKQLDRSSSRDSITKRTDCCHGSLEERHSITVAMAGGVRGDSGVALVGNLAGRGGATSSPWFRKWGNPWAGKNGPTMGPYSAGSPWAWQNGSVISWTLTHPRKTPAATAHRLAGGVHLRSSRAISGLVLNRLAFSSRGGHPSRTSIHRTSTLPLLRASYWLLGMKVLRLPRHCKSVLLLPVREQTLSPNLPPSPSGQCWA